MPADCLDKKDNRDGVFTPFHNLTGAEDVVLVAAAKGGSSHAFEVLVERHARRILCVVHRVTPNREDAEDVIQQTFQKAFVYLKTFEGRSSFSTWLTRIAINEALMYMRKNCRTRALSIDELTVTEETSLALRVPDLGPSPELRCSQGERERLLFLAMDQLTPGIRTAIQLCELDERSLKESAQMMGVSISAVKSRVLRGRRKLRETLNRRIAPTRMFGIETLQINNNSR
jgi:RNA polymerase sigma-70 factor (ECF subfamily)